MGPKGMASSCFLLVNNRAESQFKLGWALSDELTRQAIGRLYTLLRNLKIASMKISLFLGPVQKRNIEGKAI